MVGRCPDAPVLRPARTSRSPPRPPGPRHRVGARPPSDSPAARPARGPSHGTWATGRFSIGRTGKVTGRHARRSLAPCSLAGLLLEGAIMCVCRITPCPGPRSAARLAPARNYWLCTTTPSGAPHAAPVWGVTGGTRYLYNERHTIKARNLATDPRDVVHLESGEDVVIVRGTAADLGAPARSPRWLRPCRRNTTARATGGTCQKPTLRSTWSTPSGHSW
jgi:Pyridoxamine 5'-phosphate oxidase